MKEHIYECKYLLLSDIGTLRILKEQTYGRSTV